MNVVCCGQHLRPRTVGTCLWDPSQSCRHQSWNTQLSIIILLFTHNYQILFCFLVIFYFIKNVNMVTNIIVYVKLCIVSPSGLGTICNCPAMSPFHRNKKLLSLYTQIIDSEKYFYQIFYLFIFLMFGWNYYEDSGCVFWIWQYSGTV